MNTLESFKKANKIRRQKMAENAGYKSVEDYRKSLLIHKEVTNRTSTKADSKANNMVIAFDTTGSMRSYIGAVRQHVKELIPTLFKNTPNLKIKIIAFGDYIDMSSSTKFGDAYQQSNLTNDENQLINFINTAKNTSGGDTDEFYEVVIKRVIEETPWGKNSTKTVLLIGDSNPHPAGSYYLRNSVYITPDWREEARKAAKLGIKFDTLMIHPNVNWYEELSKITNGTALPFKTSGNTSEVIEASTYFSAARGGSSLAKASFEGKMRSAMLSGDSELIGMYKSFNEKL